MKISLIAVIGKNRELGRDNKLLFDLKKDMAHFKEKTTGHVVIMGRKTYESIGRLLPDRTNIVITRDVPTYVKRHPELAFDNTQALSEAERVSEPVLNSIQESEAGSRIESGMTRGVAVASIEEAIEVGKNSIDSGQARLAEASSKRARMTGKKEVFVIGGAQIYKEFLPYADKLYLTIVDAEASDADAFFPEYEKEFKKIISSRGDEENGTNLTFLEFER